MCVRVRMDGIVQLGVVLTCVVTHPSIDCSLDTRTIQAQQRVLVFIWDTLCQANVHTGVCVGQYVGHLDSHVAQ